MHTTPTHLNPAGPNLTQEGQNLAPQLSPKTEPNANCRNPLAPLDVAVSDAIRAVSDAVNAVKSVSDAVKAVNAVSDAIKAVNAVSDAVKAVSDAVEAVSDAVDAFEHGSIDCAGTRRCRGN